MTDKPGIVDGIYVEGCGHYWNGRCHAYVDNTGKFLLCINSPNCYYKQLKRAENQIVDLNKMVDIKEQECDQLKVELEQEKALKETYLTCYKAKHGDIDGELFKLKQTIIEIKEIAKEQIPYLNIGEAKTMIEIEYDHAGAICNLEQRMYKILQKIKACEVENAG